MNAPRSAQPVDRVDAYPPDDRIRAAFASAAPQSQADRRISPLPRLGPSHGNPVNAFGPVAVKPTATLACPIVSALDRWLADSVQPAAMRWFGARVVEIKQISAYSCRGMNGNSRAHISEHAFGNALDIAAFTLADGRRITVKDGWRGMPEEQGFLRDVQGAACQQFNTVLAPGSNVYHYDHIHVDLMRRASRRVICQPAAVSGEEIAARARTRNPYASRDTYGDGIARAAEKPLPHPHKAGSKVNEEDEFAGRIDQDRLRKRFVTSRAAPAGRARRPSADRACTPSSATVLRRVACFAASAMSAALAGSPCNAASDAVKPQRDRRDAAGGEADELERAGLTTTARAHTSTSGHSAWLRLMARL